MAIKILVRVVLVEKSALNTVCSLLPCRRIALQDLNARLAKKQEPLEEWPTLFDEEARSPSPAEPLIQPGPVSSQQPPAQLPTPAKDALPDV